MIRQKQARTFLALVSLGITLSGCGGGGGSAPAQSPWEATLAWDTPQSFTDGTPLVPSRDLQGFEIYIRQDSAFGAADVPLATAGPADTAFNLGTIVPPLSRGATYYVSIRVVTAYDVKSGFSPAVAFSIPP
jgi:hypothetical protein